ncbi:uncharacterized protein FIBRA_02318 [Fibroporia radiculosa]|uniref:Uncharacterized protein n=1 Tax=Fibroporia radiculosa TaxID=599839 RepID=J4G1L0_9APHY|nr:uncharacterized protein FIBRA_02318 [Fibroporia radiculosa]CCM00288.1 predicted protein [Fibroporia radiculosa]
MFSPPLHLHDRDPVSHPLVPAYPSYHPPEPSPPRMPQPHGQATATPSASPELSPAAAALAAAKRRHDPHRRAQPQVPVPRLRDALFSPGQPPAAVSPFSASPSSLVAVAHTPSYRRITTRCSVAPRLIGSSAPSSGACRCASAPATSRFASARSGQALFRARPPSPSA